MKYEFCAGGELWSVRIEMMCIRNVWSDLWIYKEWYFVFSSSAVTMNLTDNQTLSSIVLLHLREMKAGVVEVWKCVDNQLQSWRIGMMHIWDVLAWCHR